MSSSDFARRRGRWVTAFAEVPRLLPLIESEANQSLPFKPSQITEDEATWF